MSSLCSRMNYVRISKGLLGSRKKGKEGLRSSAVYTERHIYCSHIFIRGDRRSIAQWLRCCATIRKVAGSISAGVNGIFH